MLSKEKAAPPTKKLTTPLVYPSSSAVVAPGLGTRNQFTT
jgi:hypothetical protein